MTITDRQLSHFFSGEINITPNSGYDADGVMVEWLSDDGYLSVHDTCRGWLIGARLGHDRVELTDSQKWAIIARVENLIFQ